MFMKQPVPGYSLLDVVEFIIVAGKYKIFNIEHSNIQTFQLFFFTEF